MALTSTGSDVVTVIVDSTPVGSRIRLLFFSPKGTALSFSPPAPSYSSGVCTPPDLLSVVVKDVVSVFSGNNILDSPLGVLMDCAAPIGCALCAGSGIAFEPCVVLAESCMARREMDRRSCHPPRDCEPIAPDPRVGDLWGVLVLHPDVLVMFWALVIAVVLIVAKGARLKWERDRGGVVESPSAGQTIQNVETMNVTHNHFYGVREKDLSEGEGEDGAAP